MTARASAFRELQVPDMERRVADMIRLGTVAETDYSDPRAPRVKVKYGKNTTGWLPWTQRAGRARTWAPLKIGEQVIIASPSGDLRQGVVIGSLNQNSRAAPANGAHQTVTEWDGGIREEIDDDGNNYTLTVPAGGSIVLQCGQSSIRISDDGTKITTPKLTVDAPDSEFTGNVVVQLLLTYLGGLIGRNAGGGAVAQMFGDIDHRYGTLKSNDVGLHTHRHTGDSGGNTSSPQAGT